MTESLFTTEARRHARRMAGEIAPLAAGLERQFKTLLGKRPYDPAQVKALLAITPVAASRLRSLSDFLEQVDYNGRRLAKLNVPTAEVKQILVEFSALLDDLLQGRYRPVREQFHLATVLVLETAYHQVREAESQAFFALYRAELESTGLEDLLNRFVRILTRTFGAEAGRLILAETPLNGILARPLYSVGGRWPSPPGDRNGLTGRYACYWSYPLQSQALIQFGFRTRYPWLPRELALLEAVGQRCLEAIERARLKTEVRRLEAQARHAEEEERRRIGRELHDEAGQSLLLVRLQLEMMEREAADGLRPRLRETREITERTVLELRRIVAALSPAVLERMGLEPALRQLAARVGRTHPAQVRLRISIPSEPFPRQIQEVIYRVAQECLQNIVKHSQATHVNLSLQASDKSIRLRVADNGAGFRTERASAKPMSFGLAGMRERAALLGGTLGVKSAPGKGAVITLELPRTSVEVAPNVENSRTPD